MLRRSFVLGLMPAAALAASASGALATSAPRLVVSKSPTCGCCGAWAAHMRAAGFDVELRDMDQASLDAVKIHAGVPPELTSCHTGEIGGYVVEGHVPADDVKRLLALRPKLIGLAVPGMPVGSPGMEMGDAREPFDTIAFDASGRWEIFARHT
ncbi:MAG: DUF411 domain-containing protein [Pikeienuella sp.]|uniref:DUF411 domain-containing protein n=1 Tax=Pikeienuella sp. TaxID=2831957 RepID=UPI00391C3AA0